MSTAREELARVLYDFRMSISLDHCADVVDALLAHPRLREALVEAGVVDEVLSIYHDGIIFRPRVPLYSFVGGETE